MPYAYQAIADIDISCVHCDIYNFAQIMTACEKSKVQILQQ